MSRTPVREAINRLVADGLIINRARQGLYLIQPEDREIEEYIDIRNALEKLAVERCIRNISPEQKETISRRFRRDRAHLDQGRGYARPGRKTGAVREARRRIRRPAPAPTTGLNINDLNEEGRRKAVATLKEGIDEAYELGAAGFAYLSGKYAEESKEASYEAL